MVNLVIEAEPRSAFGKGPSRRLRANGRIPAVLYGENKETVPLTVNPKDIIRILRSHSGRNTIFGIQVKGAQDTDNVMIKDYQLEPVEHDLLHADLIRVAMDHQITVSVHVELTGTPVGVKNEGGLLDFVTRSVELACLPADIPEAVVVDVSELAMNQMIRAGDLALPERVTLESDPEVVIAHVVPPKKAAVEEAVAAEAPAEPAEPEVIKRGKAGEEKEEKSTE